MILHIYPELYAHCPPIQPSLPPPSIHPSIHPSSGSSFYLLVFMFMKLFLGWIDLGLVAEWSKRVQLWPRMASIPWFLFGFLRALYSRLFCHDSVFATCRHMYYVPHMVFHPFYFHTCSKRQSTSCPGRWEGPNIRARQRCGLQGTASFAQVSWGKREANISFEVTWV